MSADAPPDDATSSPTPIPETQPEIESGNDNDDTVQPEEVDDDADAGADASQNRRSGRVVRAPAKFSPEAYASQNGAAPSSKRKRDADPEQDDEDDDASSQLSEIEDPGDDEQEDADDGEQPAATKSRKKPSQRAKPRKPAIKRPKTNGNGPAVKLPNRPKKTVRLAIANRDDNALYTDIFGSGQESDDVAGHWFQRYQENNPEALTELINCVLLSAGCEQKLTEDDIQDPDNSANRLTELEEAYEQTTISDYPLISRARSSKNFRDLLVGFFDSLIRLLHQTETLYNDEELLENIQRWVGIMSSSALRPFRHTATTIGLAMLTSLVTVAALLDNRISTLDSKFQTESARKGKNKNKALIDSTKQDLDGATENRQFVDTKSKDLFDIIFVHRYRDIDPKIRAECIEALGSWIRILPTIYMSPEYLRYLGWLLSDIAVPTRHEVLRQLTKVLGKEVGQLQHFIDRFRNRLVEMATRDTDASVRVAAVAVVNVLRASGMLEPEEVDSVSKLLFDSEVRIRKSVVDFFLALVGEFIDNKIDDIGGKEALEEVFGKDDDDNDDYDSIRRDWLNVKALAENLAVYDAQLEEEQDEIRHGLDVAADVVNTHIPDSRITLAAQVLYEKSPEINNWQIIAGYLLYDHTTSAKSNSRSKKTNSIEAALKKAVVPEPREEAILLEVLAAAVKENLSNLSEHEKTRRRNARADPDSQEDAGVQLAAIIPRLLNKFGPDPAMAATVLRMEHFLDLELFGQLRQNSATYEKLLDEITTHFNRHVDQGVLNEVAAAFVHARQHEELEELADSKLSVLWDNLINSLRNIDKTCELSARGNLDRVVLNELSRVLMKTSKLGPISDCTRIMEANGQDLDSEDPVIKILIRIVHRGFLEEPNEELDDAEDELVSFAIKCCFNYFMWKIRELQALVQKDEEVSDEQADNLIIRRRDLITNLILTFSSRGFNDDLRLMSVGTACDISTMLVFLRPVVRGAQASKYGKLRPLLDEMPEELITKEMIPIFDSAEHAFAKRTHKALNDPADDEDPLELDDELPPEDDEEEDLSEAERHAAELKAEKILCDLTAKFVMAIVAKVIDHKGPHAGKLRKRLNRNKTKLGPNYKEVVAFLDEDHLLELRNGKKKPAAKGGNKEKDAAAKKPLSTELVIDDDEDPFDDEQPEEGTEEDLRRRELLDDPIEDDDEEAEDGQQAAANDDDDDMLGD